MVDVGSFSEGTAERAFAEWLAAWKAKDFVRMAAFSEQDWQNSEGDPAATLQAFYGDTELLGAEFTNKDRTSEVASDITATIYRLNFFDTDVLKKRITARIFRETEAGELSPIGEWGVNPISTLREEDVQ